MPQINCCRRTKKTLSNLLQDANYKYQDMLTNFPDTMFVDLERLELLIVENFLDLIEKDILQSRIARLVLIASALFGYFVRFNYPAMDITILKTVFTNEGNVNPSNGGYAKKLINNLPHINVCTLIDINGC